MEGSGVFIQIQNVVELPGNCIKLHTKAFLRTIIMKKLVFFLT